MATAAIALEALRVADLCFDAIDQLRRDVADAVLRGMLTGLLEHFGFRLATHDVCAAARRIHFGAFENFGQRCLRVQAA